MNKEIFYTQYQCQWRKSPSTRLLLRSTILVSCAISLIR